MRRVRAIPILIVALFLAATSVRVGASMVMQFNLAQMCARAHLIVRGTILSSDPGTIAVGGGQLPIVTYRVQVDETFRGEVQEVKGVRIAQLRMLGKSSPVRSGNLISASPLPKMPTLTVGHTYLLFTTQPSAVGLSATVGLGQGSFSIYREGKDELAVNEANNSGLFRDMNLTSVRARASSATTLSVVGPIAYDELARQIRAALGK